MFQNEKNDNKPIIDVHIALNDQTNNIDELNEEYETIKKSIQKRYLFIF